MSMNVSDHIDMMRIIAQNMQDHAASNADWDTYQLALDILVKLDDLQEALELET